MNKLAFIIFNLSLLIGMQLASGEELLSTGSIKVIDSQLNGGSWGAKNLLDSNRRTRWLSNKQTNDLNFVFNDDLDAACFNQVGLENYGTSKRSVSGFMLFYTEDETLASNTSSTGWTPIPYNANPVDPVNHLHSAQGGQLTSVDSEINNGSWGAKNTNDGSLTSRWLSRKSNNSLTYVLNPIVEDGDDPEISITDIKIHNYGNDDRSVKLFQIEYTVDGTLWEKLEVPGSAAGDSSFDYTSLWEGGVLSDINGQLNTTTWAAKNIHDGDLNSRWLNRGSNNTLDFKFDVDNDNTTGVDGDSDDFFNIEEIHLKNYGKHKRSIQDFQVEVKTNTISEWTKLEVPGSVAGDSEFNFLLDQHGGQTSAIAGELNATSWAAANIHDGDSNTRWLNRQGNNTLDFTFDVNESGTAGFAGDIEDFFKIEKLYLQNYGKDDRSVKQFQVEVKTDSNNQWTKIEVPGSVADEPNHNFVLAAHGGTLTTIDGELNNTTWAASRLHDGDPNTRWLNRRQTNTLEFKFDTNYDGNTGDVINLDSIKLLNYGTERAIATFEVDIKINGDPWQTITTPGSGTTFKAKKKAKAQEWKVGPFTNVTATRIRTLTNHGDRRYTGASEIEFLGNSVAPGVTFSASMNDKGQTFLLDTEDQPNDVTAVRFRTINNHGDSRYTGAREFKVLGPSIAPSTTFTAAMHDDGETWY